MVNFQEKPENKPFLIKIKRFSHSDQDTIHQLRGERMGSP